MTCSQSFPLHATTVLALYHHNKAVMVSDGQVTFGDMVLKAKAHKVRKLYSDSVLAGFAGGAADAFSLFERFEEKLIKFSGTMSRAAVEMAKDWRNDRYLRRLDAQLVVLNNDTLFLLSGNGDIIEPDDAVMGIGSGGAFALAAARALMRFSDLDADTIASEAMKIAASICIYTNDQLTIESLD